MTLCYQIVSNVFTLSARKPRALKIFVNTKFDERHFSKEHNLLEHQHRYMN